jgi:hypothetical protein
VKTNPLSKPTPPLGEFHLTVYRYFISLIGELAFGMLAKALILVFCFFSSFSSGIIWRGIPNDIQTIVGFGAAINDTEWVCFCSFFPFQNFFLLCLSLPYLPFSSLSALPAFSL